MLINKTINAIDKKEEKPHIGGQAVIEGVMIRNKDIYSIAIRKPNGEIEVVKKDINSPVKKYKILRAPFVRGITALIENLVLGVKSLLYSAQKAMPEDENVEKDKNKSDKKNSSDLIIVLSMIPAIILGVVLFVVIPNIATHYIGVVEKTHPFVFHIIAGFIRLTMFILYILAISLLKDIKRTFQYHGAEHKSIYCYEAGKPLVVEEARRYKTLHPRCGTSFLFFVFFIAIIVFPIITVSIELLYPPFVNYNLLLRKTILILSHIIIALPIIASVSYELLRITDKLKNAIFMKILIAPGLFLQRITTQEPTDDQLEVAIEAVKAVL